MPDAQAQEPSGSDPGGMLTSIFLLCEFEALEQARTVVISIRDRQLNLYVILASILVTAIVLGHAIAQPFTRSAFSVSVGTGLLVFAIFGLILAYRAAQAQLSATMYLRGMNRIRRYFLEQDEAISKYLVLPINDDIPRFGEVFYDAGPLSRIFGIDILAFVNAGAVLCGACLLVFEALPTVDRRASVALCVLFAATWLRMQLVLHRSQTRQAESRFLAEFPSTAAT